ncbi:MAG: hypothetical protein A2X55_07790 [Nitrospirae bacterium GWB2_47_37]|nr:MAG: hypothetical protein A2X55_07790 [Nitrospirae bacterium GWB2_47_37]
MKKLSLNDAVRPGVDYVFEHSKGFFEIVVDLEKLREHFNIASNGYFFVESISVFGTLKLNVRFVQSYTVDIYAQWFDKLLDDFMWFNTNFVAAYEGSYSLIGSAAETTGQVLKPVAGELSKILIPVAVIVVGGLILWKRL